MKKSDANGDTHTAMASGTASSSGWMQLAGLYNFNVSGTLSGLTLYFEMPSSSTADFYVDDVSVTWANSSNFGTNGTSLVNWTDVRQRIDGFGASSAWRSSWSSSVADMYKPADHKHCHRSRCSASNPDFQSRSRPLERLAQRLERLFHLAAFGEPGRLNQPGKDQRHR